MPLAMPHSAIILDALTPFMLENKGARGRVVRLSGVANRILSHYPYPPAVAHLLGELLLVASMLSANLKQDGILTIQLRGDGPVSLAVVDITENKLRGYAEVTPDATFAETMTPEEIMGAGAYLAITVDPGAGMQRYQGIVALDGADIAEVLLHYFTQSQQVDVFLKLAVAKGQDGAWQAGGLMLERLAEDGGHSQAGDVDDQWRTAKILAATIKPTELLDPLLVGDALLYRLFHEEGVWVYAPHLLGVGCRCSRERILTILSGMPLDDRTEMVVNGAIDVHCQFCNTSQRFTPEEIGVSGDAA